MYPCSVGHGGPSELYYVGLMLGKICSCCTPSASVVASECVRMLVGVMKEIHLFVTLLYELQKNELIHLWYFTHQFTSPSVPAWLFRTKM